ncbi:MAG: S26 family signal peptidase [Acidimicrobiales bacterium]
MMGDNRTDSTDSRVFGPVPGGNFIGHALVRIWPLSRLHWF